MPTRKQIIAAVAVFTVMALTVGFFSLASEIGGRESPLVTLDYLRSLDPQIEQTISDVVRQQLAEQSAELEGLISRAGGAVGAMPEGGIDVNALLQDENFVSRVAAAIAEQARGSSDAAAERVVVPSGQTLHLPEGSSVVLRLGTGTVRAPNNPGLIDITAGSTLNNGQTLTQNHKYFVSMETGRDIEATGGRITVFVWGPYVIFTD